MSTTIDSKVVEMKFDNSNFEKNVSTSLNTLSDLKKSLKMEGATEGLENVNEAAQSVDLSSLEESVQSLADRFSTLGIVGMEVITELTSAILDKLSSAISSVTSQIVSGGITRALNLEKAEFLLDGLLDDEEAVEAVMENVNAAVDGTAYSLDSAALVASQLVASGMTAGDELQSVLDGIAGVAAMTDSEYSDIGDIFTTIAGNGKLMTEQLRQFSSRGLNVAATLSDYFTELTGSAEYTESVIREMVSDGEIDFETFAAAMNWAFGDQAKEANETFSGALSNVQSALARIGALFVTDLVDRNGTLVNLLNATRLWINDIKTEITEFAEMFVNVVTKISDALTEWLTNLDMTDFWEGFYDFVDAASNLAKGLWSVLKPIGQAFKDIFPNSFQTTWKNVASAVKNFTENLKLSDESSENLRSTFQGLFSVVKLVWNIFKSVLSVLSPVRSGAATLGATVLKITGYIGKLLTNLNDWVEENELLNKGVEAVNSVFSKFKDILSAVGNYAGGAKDAVIDAIEGIQESVDGSGFLSFLSSLWSVIQTVFTGIVTLVKNIASTISSKFGSVNDILGTFIDLLKDLASAGLIVSIANFVNQLSKIGKKIESITKIGTSIKKVFTNLGDALKTWQKELKAKTLTKIATAVAILAASMLILSYIDSDKMSSAITGLASAATVLAATVGVLNKINAGKTKTNIVKLAAAIGILTLCLKSLSELSWSEVARGATGLLSVAAILVSAIAVLSKIKSSKVKTQIVLLSASIAILTACFKSLSELSWSQIATGTSGLLSVMGTLVAAIALLSKIESSKVKTQMIFLSAAIAILTACFKSLAELSWEEIAKGATALVSVAGTLVAAIVLLSKYATNKVQANFILFSAAVGILTACFKSLAELSWEEIAKGATALVSVAGTLVGAIVLLSKYATAKIEAKFILLASAIGILTLCFKSLAELSWGGIAKGAAGLLSVAGTLVAAIAILSKINTSGSGKTAASLLAISAALLVLTPVLKTLGNMSWESLAKGILAIASALTVFGVAAYALSGVSTTMLAIAAAMALFGVGIAAVGAGVLALGVGLTSLAVGISATLDLIPELFEAIAEGIVAAISVFTNSFDAITELIKALVTLVITVIVDAVPELVSGVMQLILGVLDALVTYTPTIVNYIFDFLIAILDCVAERLPELIQSAINVISSFFSGLMSALGSIDIDTLLKGSASVALLSVMMLGLGTAASLIPSAMVGVLGLGVVIAELAVVLAAIGALAQIPGLSWLIDEGGELLEGIGTAIGKFVGGIVGGIAEGISDSFPDIAANLSSFMVNIEPFISGAMSIDTSILKKITILSAAIIAISAADVFSAITSWIIGDSSMSSFANQLVTFGDAMLSFGDAIADLDIDLVNDAATAGKVLSEMASTIPASGGIVDWFAGNNDLDSFSEKLVPFGEAMVEFAESVEDLDASVVEKAATAGASMVELANTIPNSGGIVEFFSGSNDIYKFGEQLVLFGEYISEFADSVIDIDISGVEAAKTAGSMMVELADTIPNTGGVVSWFTGNNDMDVFGEQLVIFGSCIKEFSDEVIGLDSEAVEVASVAGLMMSEMASTLPNTGGVVSWFTGNNDMDVFGEQLVIFGSCIKEFSDEVIGIDSGAIEAASIAGSSLSAMAETIPSSGGIFEIFVGSTDMSAFGKQLVLFGIAMTEFAAEVSGITDYDAVIAASVAGSALGAMADTMPTSGGIFDFFSGSFDMNSLSEQLPAFGEAIAGFAEKVEGITNYDAVNSAATAGKTLAEMSSSIPTSGGVFEIFTGVTDMEAFGEDLVAFGEAMADFAEAVYDIDSSVVENGAYAGKALVEMANEIPETGGVFDIFTGVTDMPGFGEDLVSFGQSIAGFADAVSNISSYGNISLAATAGSKLIEMAQDIPSSTVFDAFTGIQDISGFGENLVSFGQSLSSFYTKIKGLDDDAVAKIQNAADASSELISMVDELDESGGIFDIFTGTKDLDSFGSSLEAYGGYLISFSDLVANLGVDSIENAINSSSNLAELASVISEINDFSVYSEFGAEIKSLGNKFSNFYSSISDIDTLVVSSVVSQLKNIVNLGNYINSESNSGLSSFSDSLKTLGDTGIDNFVAAFTNSDTKIKNAIKSMLETATNTISNQKAVFKESGKTLVSQFADGIENNKNVPKTKWISILSESISSIRNYYDNFYNAGEYLIDAFTKSIKDNKDSPKTKFAASASSSVSEVRNYYSSFYDAGKYLVEGFASGITKNTYLATAKAKAMAAAAVKAAEDELDINSPSKVGYSIGNYFGLGFINAIGDSASEAYDSSAEMAEGAMNGLNSALSAIAISVDDEIDSNPVITPVLDLSEIQNGILQLYTMVGNVDQEVLNGSMDVTNSTSRSVSRAENARYSESSQNSSGNTTNQTSTFNNTFNISGSNNPQEIATQVSKILQKQVERKNSVWA